MEPGKFGFWSILGPQKSRQNGQLAFESGEGEQQVNQGEGASVPPCPNVEPSLIGRLEVCKHRPNNTQSHISEIVNCNSYQLPVFAQNSHFCMLKVRKRMMTLE